MTNEETKSSVGIAVFSLIVSIASCAACYLAAGASFDFFLGSVLFATLICPILAASAHRAAGGWIAAGCVWLVNIGWWLVVGRMAGVTVGQWLLVSLILAGMLGLMSAATRVQLRWGVAPVIASAIVTVAQLLWLTWPVWLSPSISGTNLDWSVSLHPLLVMNGVLKALGIWAEQPIAYNLTTLGQDVQYRLPTSAWPVIGAQAAAAIVLVMLSRLDPRRRVGLLLA